MLGTIVTILHLSICIFLILIVLLQQGRGADIGATFGGGGNTIFGASGADNLLTRVTTVCAGLFMVTSVILAGNLHAGAASRGNLFKNVAPVAPEPETAAPDAAPAAAVDGAKTDTSASTSTPEAEAPAAAPASKFDENAAPADAAEAAPAATATEASPSPESRFAEPEAAPAPAAAEQPASEQQANP